MVDNNLVLPVGKKVRFLLTSNDVIHGWWVPDLAIKKDAIPGFINDMWTQINEPGVYRGQCTVLCGRDHGFMPVVVEAKSEADYAAWLAKMKGGETVAAAAPVTATDAAVDAPAPAAAEAAPVEVAARLLRHLLLPRQLPPMPARSCISATAPPAIRPPAPACRRPSRR